MYDFMNDHQGLMACPADYTNSDEVIGALDNFVSINNALQVDLFSQVSAESVVTGGVPQQISGTGGRSQVLQREELHLHIIHLRGPRRHIALAHSSHP
jgi:acyl-CoA hydrolase